VQGADDGANCGLGTGQAGFRITLYRTATSYHRNRENLPIDSRRGAFACKETADNSVITA